MPRKKRRIEQHEASETEPCDECRAELALLRRAREYESELRILAGLRYATYAPHKTPIAPDLANRSACFTRKSEA